VLFFSWLGLIARGEYRIFFLPPALSLHVGIVLTPFSLFLQVILIRPLETTPPPTFVVLLQLFYRPSVGGTLPKIINPIFLF